MHIKTTIPALMASLVLTLGCGSSNKANRDGDDDTATDTATDTPADTPADTPTDTPTDVPTDTPADTPTDTGCPAGTGDCDGNPGNGCETDLTTDAAHCGACDHDCEGGTCVASACQPVHVADPPGTGTSPGNGFLALGPTSVYWGYRATPTGDVAMAAKDGSSSSCIECGVGEPRELATDATSVYWANTGTGELKSAPLGGGTVSALWSGTIGSPVAVDTSHVYWWDRGSNTVMMANTDGSSPTAVASSQPEVHSIAAHSGHVFWISQGNVREIALSGGSVNTLASGLLHPRSVQSDGSHVYWMIGDWDIANNELQRVPVGGGTVEVVATRSAYSITLDATHVYCADNFGGEIWRVPLDGGAVEMLATGQPYPFDIVVDATAAFWSSETDGGIRKVAK
jgi:hypothetical protein